MTKQTVLRYDGQEYPLADFEQDPRAELTDMITPAREEAAAASGPWPAVTTFALRDGGTVTVVVDPGIPMAVLQLDTGDVVPFSVR